MSDILSILNFLPLIIACLAPVFIYLMICKWVGYKADDIYRSFWAWFFITLFFSPFISLPALFLMGPSKEYYEEDEEEYEE